MQTTKPQTVIFIGTKYVGFECFKYLVEKRKDHNIKISAVLTDLNKSYSDDIIKLAKQKKIPVLKNLSELKKVATVDYIICVQYPHILKDEHLAIAQKEAFNLHMAPLPEYRGCNQFSFAIDEAKKEFGTTIHIMEAGIDSGDIVSEKRFPIPKNCFVNELYEITVRHSIELFKKSLKTLVSATYRKTPQATLIKKRGSAYHFRYEIDTLNKIDLNWKREKIERRLRATMMPGFTGPYIEVSGKKIYFQFEGMNK